MLLVHHINHQKEPINLDYSLFLQMTCIKWGWFEWIHAEMSFEDDWNR